MKVPSARILRAVIKRSRAMEGPSDTPAGPSPKRAASEVGPPRERQAPPAAPEVNLTADTPPEGEEEEVVARPAASAEAAPVEEHEGAPEVGSPPAEPERGPLEEPTGESGLPPSPPGAEAGTSGPAQAEPGCSVAAEGRNAGPAPRGSSLMSDGRQAERIISEVARPEFIEELRNTGASRFYREAYAALVRVSSSLVTTRIVLNEWDDTITETRVRAEAAEQAAESLKAALESARSDLAAELKRAEAAEQAAESLKAALESAKSDRAAELKRAEERAEDEAARARAALCQLTLAGCTIEARDRRLSELEAELRTAKGEAEEAQKAAADSASKAAEAEARAVGAVTAYKASEEFLDEMAEAGADAYLQGFRYAKEKIARELNVPEALSVELGEEPVGTRSGDESATDAHS